ncbi:MAG: hypothetical protein M3R10_03885 [Verrucomicrobiota bacterium]|nr:hypothetical protein [Verrucomicrobiota bacterium]
MQSRILVAAFLFLICNSIVGAKTAAADYKQLTKVDQLPVALDSDFQFRKTKLFSLGDIPGGSAAKRFQTGRPGPKDPSVGFESAYRLYGAVTELDKRQRYGNYFDFFWRARRPATITIRLEYQQEKLRTLTQAREITYPNAHGHIKTEFAVIGDDYLNDGRVLAWRCVLIEKGRIVAEDRSYLWR